MEIKAFTDYLLLERHYSKHTVLAYERDVLQFADFLEITDEQHLLDVDYNDIRGFVTTLLDAGLSAKSVNRKISSLKAFYKFQRKIDALDFNPLVVHKSIKVAKKVQVPFSKTEVAAILEQSRDATDFTAVRNLLIIELLYATGMRRKELIDLTLQGVDAGQKTITVLGKGNKERKIPMLTSLATSLTNYLALRSQVAAVGCEVLLITEKGKPISPSMVYRVVNDYFSQVSQKVKTSPHVLRHSFATHLLDSGAELNTIKELLGHASLASTQVYTTTSMARLKDIHKTAHPRATNRS